MRRLHLFSVQTIASLLARLQPVYSSPLALSLFLAYFYQALAIPCRFVFIPSPPFGALMPSHLNQKTSEIFRVCVEVS